MQPPAASPDLPELKTADAVRADFDARGIAIAQWASEQGFDPKQVYKVLARGGGRWGEAHRIAVALGMKHGAKTADHPAAV